MFYLRNRLHRSEPPTAARRTNGLCRAAGAEKTLPPEVKRQIMVERVARELFENLLFTESANPMAAEVRETLDRELGEPLFFQYLTGESDLAVLRDTQDGPQEVSSVEKIHILDRAWAITLAQVDGTML